jgi:hypothetical protein
VDAALIRGLEIAIGRHVGRVAALIVERRNASEILAEAFARPRARANAAAAMVALGKARLGSAREVLERARGDAETRALAASTLRAIDGDPPAPVVPAIASFETALVDAAAFGKPSPAELLPFLTDGRPIVRANAATGLGASKAVPFAGVIAPLMRDDDARVRIAVAKALDQLGDEAIVIAAPALIHALRFADTAEAAKLALAPRAAKIVPALIAGLDTDDETHGLRVAEIIVPLPDAPKLLFEAFDGPAQNAQISAAFGIALLGPKRAGNEGLARLRSGLPGPPTRRRHAIVKALAMFDARA